MNERIELRPPPSARRVHGAFVIAAALAGCIALTSCRSTPASQASAPDRGPEIAQLRERLDKVTQRIDSLIEQQSTRLVAVEMRTSQLESRQRDGESRAEDVDAVRAELAQLRLDLTALAAQQEADRMYHERLDRLERALGLAERSLAGPETFDSIWQWYVTRRNELRQQGEPVAASTAKP